MGKGKGGSGQWSDKPDPQAAKQACASILSAACRVAGEIGSQTILLYIDGLEDLAQARELSECGCRLILVARSQEQADQVDDPEARVLIVPPVRLSRVDQLKLAILFAFSRRLLRPGETFLGLVGIAGEPIDSLMVLTVGREWEVFQSVDQPPITEHIRRAVFQRVLNLAIRLAAEGREGRPVGALFVIGDIDEVEKCSHQMILNPFHGYPPEQRNILDDSLMETVREYSILDGAFLIRGNGEIVSAGVYLQPTESGEILPHGLGARHASAASISATTHCLAVTISESTGTVRVWRRGQMITEIRRAASILNEEGDVDG